MNCEEILILMNEKLDGCISPEDEKVLTEHLDKSASSRGLFEKLKQADSGVRECRLEPPATLHDGVMDKIRQEKTGKTGKRTWITVAAVAGVAAVFAILAGVGIVQMPGMQDGGKVNSVSMSDAMRPAPSQKLPDAPHAAETATQKECAVTVFWSCSGLAELENAEHETLDDGAELYTVTPQVLDTLVQKYQKVYPIGTFYPEGDCRKDTAIIMILK